MPTDISGAVTAEYTDAIPVPLDGEYANSTALQNMVLPIANRVEYLNQGLINSPFELPVIKEDWLHFEKVSNVIYGDSGPWSYAESGVAFTTPFQSTATVSGTAGAMRLENTSGTAAVIQLRKTARISRNKLVRLSFRLQMFSAPANCRFQIGMFDSAAGTTIGSGDTSGFGIQYDPAVNANFRTVGVDAGAYTYTDTGVPPVAGFHYQFDINFDPSTFVPTLDIGAVGAHAFAGLPAIGTDLLPDCRFGSLAAGTRQINWDLFYLQMTVPRY